MRACWGFAVIASTLCWSQISWQIQTERVSVKEGRQWINTIKNKCSNGNKEQMAEKSLLCLSSSLFPLSLALSLQKGHIYPRESLALFHFNFSGWNVTLGKKKKTLKDKGPETPLSMLSFDPFPLFAQHLVLSLINTIAWASIVCQVQWEELYT